MKDKFTDHNLKIDSSLYESICIPLRLAIGIVLISGVIPTKFLPIVGLLLLGVAGGLFYKSQISGNSWKCYQRAIIVYMLIATLIFTNMVYPIKNIELVAGLLMIVDVLMGIQSKHVFEKLG